MREGGWLTSFPPVMASACPVGDRFHVTGEAPVVVMVANSKEDSRVMRNQRRKAFVHVRMERFRG